MKRSITLGLTAALALGVAALGSTTGATAGSEAGSGGELNLLQWQAPSVINSYLSGGTKDVLAASLVLEPLANFSPEGELVPKLAAEIPTIANGGFAEDLMSITWTLKDGVLWSDGTPFTAADVAFTFEYATAENAPIVINSYEGVAAVTAVDDLTVRIDFEAPTPYPYAPFVGALAPVLQQAQFADFVGAEAGSATEANQYPIGTGPFKVVDFRAEDTVVYELNENYRGIAEGQPHFSTVVIKGGGDAAAAARTVLEEGGADYAWNLQVPPEVLAQLEAAGLGRVEVGFGANLEHINLNQTNNRNSDAPSEYLDGQNPHPIFASEHGPTIARAMSLAIDRSELVEVGYGNTGRVATNVWNPPPAVSPNNDWALEQDLDEANRLLDEAGIVDTNDDGIRELDGEPLIFDYYTSTNAVRQDFQSLVQGYWSQIGIGVSLRNSNAGIFFGPATNDFSYLKFLADLQMYTFVPLVDPQLTLDDYTLANMPGEANGWAGDNVPRYVNEEYEALIAELAETGDLDARNELVIQLNDKLIEDGVVIPLVWRGSVSAFANDIQGVGALNGWDSEYWNIADWYREG